MIAKQRMVVLAVVLAGAAGACKRFTSAPDASNGAASADPIAAEADSGVRVGVSNTEIVDDPTAGDAAVNVPAAPEERKAALAALVSGSGNASALPVSATDPGVGFDRSLRKRLTTVELPPADPLSEGGRARPSR